MYVRTVRKSYRRFCQNQNFLDAQITRFCYSRYSAPSASRVRELPYQKTSFQSLSWQKNEEKNDIFMAQRELFCIMHMYVKNEEVRSLIQFLNKHYFKAYFDTSSVHKLPHVSILFCILRTILRLCMRNSIFVKPQKYRHKYRNKLYLRKLGSAVAFSVKPGLR